MISKQDRFGNLIVQLTTTLNKGTHDRLKKFCYDNSMPKNRAIEKAVTMLLDNGGGFQKAN